VEFARRTLALRVLISIFGGRVILHPQHKRLDQLQCKKHLTYAKVMRKGGNTSKDTSGPSFGTFSVKRHLLLLKRIRNHVNTVMHNDLPAP